MKKWLIIIIAFILMICGNSNILAQWKKDVGNWEPISFNEDTMPPQILGWYDSDILLRKRPTYYYLKNNDIWNLPEESEVDIIVLDYLRIDLLTSIQIQKLQDWIRSGIDISISLRPSSGSFPLEKLEFLFGFQGKKFSSIPVRRKFYLNRKHIINTDVTEEKLNLGYIEVMTDLPKETLVIIGTNKDLSEAIMGIIHYGRGRIIFSLLREWGNLNYTRSRLQLNLSQWLIGKDIPIVTLKDIQEGRIFGRINFRGRIISGWLSDPTDTHITLKNPETRMIIPWRGIQWIEVKDKDFKTKIPEFVPLYLEEIQILPSPSGENLGPKASFYIKGDLAYQGEGDEGGEGVSSERIKGPAGGRAILRSAEPEYPAWAEASGVKGEVELKFWVLPGGKVSQVEVWKTSGWSGFDASASQALKEWRFEPIEGREKQWGIISFVFEF